MPKIAVDWSRTRVKTDVKPALARYRRYLEKREYNYFIYQIN
jgi:hypothetical protein